MADPLMAYFIVNEWLWDHIKAGDSHERATASKLLKALVASNHRLVLVEDSPFDHKAWASCKSRDMVVQRLGVIFLQTFRINLDRCHRLRLADLPPLPDMLAKQVNPDDHYLAQAQLALPGAIVVTTDTKLRDTLQKNRIHCISREQFLSEYFNIPA